MKILMFTSRFGFGYGMGYSAYKEASALVSLGHSVTMVHCYSNREMVSFYDPRITFIYSQINQAPLIGFLIYFFKLKKLINTKITIKDFDVVYIQSLEFGLLDLATVKIPIFYFARSTMRGMQQALQNENVKISLFSRVVNLVLVALEQRCMDYSKNIFVKSHKMAREVSNLYGVNFNKLAVISGGIDDKEFSIQSEASIVEFKHKFMIPTGVPIMLYAGRIVPQKGLEYLTKACLDLLKEINFIVVIAGANSNKSYYTKIKYLLNNSTHQKSFHFIGHIDQLNMSAVLNLADCLVTPSFYEPFGMVNLQAAFLNKKIITTEATGSVEILANYGEIKIVRAKSSADIELALREVLSWKNKKNQTAIDFKMYSWQTVAEYLVRFFSAAV